ncbi:iron-sulfur cluster biosynthesis protein, NifU-like protein [Desulfosporosinus acidiphilus SJ4]|uniref:Iron-sulfur cluster biosynthesis protein, NifU-like protein n=2 Tax=Desulfosporosinus TaxID=79206 RepID=I4D8P9_DESAJ|nr:iron-sulfur cluster biosynthesis protein, NifU-like protein [Desulfosporosinus acidiphilus SJ4]
MYSQKFLELITNPMNQGKMQNSDGEGTVEDPQSGANCTIEIKVEFGIIKSISFWVSGDNETIACCSMTTILAKGKHLAEALKITKQDVKDALEWSVEADHPGIDLALGTLRKTIQNYLLRRGIYHIQFENLDS